MPTRRAPKLEADVKLEPTLEPTLEPSPGPELDPTEPTLEPTLEPSPGPELDPTLEPKLEPSERARACRKRKAPACAREGELYPDFARPTAAECARAHEILVGLYGPHPRGEAKWPLVLDAVVSTILSQNTTDLTSRRAFASLKAAYPTYEGFLAAEDGACADAIREGGLADVKVARIKAILRTLREERGELSFEYLRALPTPAVREQLLRFKGVGPKTAACVLLFALQRDEMPVDTHVWKLAALLGWCPRGASRDQTYLHLNARVPDALKYELHCLLVDHGKRLKNKLGALAGVLDRRAPAVDASAAATAADLVAREGGAACGVDARRPAGEATAPVGEQLLCAVKREA